MELTLPNETMEKNDYSSEKIGILKFFALYIIRIFLNKGLLDQRKFRFLGVRYVKF